MKSLVLAEKPSVARDIARVLSCHKTLPGAIEGSKYIVTWALGGPCNTGRPGRIRQAIQRVESFLSPYDSRSLEAGNHQTDIQAVSACEISTFPQGCLRNYYRNRCRTRRRACRKMDS